MKEKRLSDLKRRVIASIIAILIVAVLILFSSNIFVQPLVMIAIAAIMLVAIWEYYQIVQAKHISLIYSLIMLGAVAEFFSFYVAYRYVGCENIPLIIFFLFLVVLFLLNFKRIEGALVRIALSSFGIIYITIPLSMLLLLLLMQGRIWITYLIAVTKITDIGAYFGGRLGGKRKLASKLSPHKTVEGSVVGLLCALATSLAFTFVNFEGFHLEVKESIILGLTLGIVGQFGDLAESLLKRDVHIKNSSGIKGLGGILDCIDSLLFNIPIIFFLLN